MGDPSLLLRTTGGGATASRQLRTFDRCSGGPDSANYSIGAAQGRAAERKRIDVDRGTSHINHW
jgi:hypothetical protein